MREPRPVESFTVEEAARWLRMSRTHLVKLVDQGIVPFSGIGAHRRINADDLVSLERQRSVDRAELAERFANQEQTRAALLEELVDIDYDAEE